MIRNTPAAVAASAPMSGAAAAQAAAADAERRAPPNADNSRNSRFAAFTPSTYDAAARTVEVVLSAGSPVRRWAFTEELEISATAINLARVTAGQCPVLDTHNQYELDAVLGRVLSARVENGQLIGLLQFGDTDQARKIEGMVARGELRGVSIGYLVRAWTMVTIDDNGHETWRATSWELLEASFVSVPADVSAGVRSAVSIPGETGATATPPHEEADMIRNAPGGAAAPAITAAAAAIATPAAPADGARAAEAAPPAAAPTAPPAAPAAPAAERVAAFTATQALEFCDTARAFNNEALVTRATDLIAQNERGEITVEAARAQLLREAGQAQRAQLGAAPAAGAAARAGGEDPNVASRAAVVDALVARALRAAPTEQGRAYMRHSLLELAAERAGVDRRSDSMTIMRAAMTTSDFPIILDTAANRILLTRYEAAVPTYRAIARRRDLADFKATSLIRAGDFPTLKRYAEDGEIKAGTITEGAETLQLFSYGRILNLTRQAIVNDDLGVFDDVFGSIGTMLARFENATFFAMKAQNSGLGPKMADGKTFFHADHGNLLAGGGSAIDIATLGAGRASIAKQKDADGNALNFTAKTLLVGPDTQTVAEQYTASITPVVNAAVNPFSGKLDVVPDGSITGNAWELYADPEVAPAFSYGYLQEAPGPRVMTKEGFTTDGVSFRVTLDFYAGAVDYRPAYRNAGG